MEAHIPGTGTQLDHLPYGVQWELARVFAAGHLTLRGQQLLEELGCFSTSSNVQGVPALHAHLGVSTGANLNISAKEREIKV